MIRNYAKSRQFFLVQLEFFLVQLEFFFSPSEYKQPQQMISKTAFLKPWNISTIYLYLCTLLWSLRIHNLKYLRSPRLGCKDIEVGKSEFVEKTQFLFVRNLKWPHEEFSDAQNYKKLLNFFTVKFWKSMKYKIVILLFHQKLKIGQLLKVEIEVGREAIQTLWIFINSLEQTWEYL